MKRTCKFHIERQSINAWVQAQVLFATVLTTKHEDKDMNLNRNNCVTNEEYCWDHKICTLLQWGTPSLWKKIIWILWLPCPLCCSDALQLQHDCSTTAELTITLHSAVTPTQTAHLRVMKSKTIRKWINNENQSDNLVVLWDYVLLSCVWIASIGSNFHPAGSTGITLTSPSDSSQCHCDSHWIRINQCEVVYGKGLSLFPKHGCSTDKLTSIF